MARFQITHARAAKGIGMGDRKERHLKAHQEVAERETHVLSIGVRANVLDDFARNEHRNEDTLPEGEEPEKRRDDEQRARRGTDGEFSQNAFDAEEFGGRVERPDADKEEGV